MITALFTFATPAPTAEQRRQLEALLDDVTLLNRRSGRFLVEAVDRAQDLLAAYRLLQQWGKEPKIIGAWRQNGTRHPQVPNIDHDEFALVAPDRYDNDGNLLPRPTQFVEIRKIVGWAERQ